jgi:hypothetical protein
LHDEIILEVREADAERASELLMRAMIEAFAETFPGASRLRRASKARRGQQEGRPQPSISCQPNPFRSR